MTTFEIHLVDTNPGGRRGLALTKPGAIALRVLKAELSPDTAALIETLVQRALDTDFSDPDDNPS